MLIAEYLTQPFKTKNSAKIADYAFCKGSISQQILTTTCEEIELSSQFGQLVTTKNSIVGITNCSDKKAVSSGIFIKNSMPFGGQKITLLASEHFAQDFTAGNSVQPTPNTSGRERVPQQILTPACEERGGELSKRLKYGQGSIRERKRVNTDGSTYRWYQVRWYDEYGIRHTATTNTKEKAEKIFTNSNPRSMKNAKKQLKTFGEYIREWYDTFRRSKCGAARNNLNITQIDRMPKEIMDKPLGKISASELQQYLNTIPQEHPRAQTKQLFIACIRHAFGNGQIKNNIGLSLEAEISKAPEKPILPRLREDEFISMFPEQYQGYVIGLIYSGARLGEFMSLNENWETDIDYKNEIVKIRETKSLRQKDIKAGTTFVYREIPLLPEFAKIKFPLPVVKQKTINKNFAKVAEKFGLNLTPHCMRHAFISRCNELGISASIIRGMVGQ